LSTHSAGGVTDLDITLAGIVDEVAAELPLAGE
jgi:pterin-4a-carbinolamine dehydratase